MKLQLVVSTCLCNTMAAEMLPAPLSVPSRPVGALRPALPLWAARSLYSSGHTLMTKPAVSITVLLIPLKINRLKIKVLMEFSKPAVPVLQSSPARNNRRFCYENQLLFQIISILHKPDVPVSSPGMNLLHTQRKICECYFHRGANVALTRAPLPNYSSTCTRRNGEKGSAARIIASVKTRNRAPRCRLFSCKRFYKIAAWWLSYCINALSPKKPWISSLVQVIPNSWRWDIHPDRAHVVAAAWDLQHTASLTTPKWRIYLP